MTTFATFATLRHLKPANLAPDLQNCVCAGQTACVASPLQPAKVQAVFAGQGQFAVRHPLRGGEPANLEPRRTGWRTWWRTSLRLLLARCCVTQNVMDSSRPTRSPTNPVHSIAAYCPAPNDPEETR